MLRRDAANERLQKIKPAALWGEASEMECRLLEQMRSADCIVQGPLTGATRKSFGQPALPVTLPAHLIANDSPICQSKVLCV
jgi:hypothetical protein